MKKSEEILLDTELDLLTEKLTEVQKQVHHLLKAGDAFVEDQPLPIQFYNRMNAGQLIETLTTLNKTSFRYVDQIKAAVEQHQKMLEAAKQAVPEGENGNI